MIDASLKMINVNSKGTLAGEEGISPAMKKHLELEIRLFRTLQEIQTS
jgi:hypothetical protein